MKCLIREVQIFQKVLVRVMGLAEMAVCWHKLRALNAAAVEVYLFLNY